MADLATITIPVDSSAMVRAVKDAKSLEGSIKLLTNALDSGVIGQKQFDAGLAQLEKQFKNLFKSADGATSSILGYVQSLRESKSATEAAAKSKDNLAMATKRAETAFALANQKAQEELQTLKNRAEFAFAMAMQKEQEIKAAQEAVRANQELINSLTGYKTAYASAENSAKTFTNELRKQEAQALETARANQEAINKQFGIGKAPATSQGAGFGAIEGEILRLEATYNKVALAARVYEQAEKSLNKAVLMGVLTADQKEAKLMEMSMAYQKVGQDANKAQAFVNRFGENAQVSGRGLNRFGMIAQQVGYQVGDFFVQIQSGTNVLVAFGQQATQLAGLIPGVWGAAIGIGISLATAIGAAFMRMGEAAEDSADKIDTQKQAFDALTESIRQSRLERQMEGSGLDETQQNATNELVKLQANLNVLLIEQTELQKAAFDSAVTMTTAEQAANEAAIASTRVAIAEAERKLALDAEEKRLVQEIKDIKAGDEETRALQQELALIREKLKYGEDSVQVKALETQQTLENYEAELRRTIVNDDIIAQLVAQKAETIAAGAELENASASAENLENALKAAASAMSQLSGFSAGLDVKIAQAAAKVEALKDGANAANAAMAAGLRAEAEQRRDAAARIAVGADQLRRINAEYADSIAKINELDKLNATFDEMSESQKKAAGGAKKLKDGLDEAAKAAEQLQKQLEAPLVSAVGSISDAFGDFVARGLRDFKGFVKSILGSFQSMIAQMIAMAVKNRIMLSLGIGGLTPGMAAAGQIPGIGAAGGMLGSFGGGAGMAGLAGGTGFLGGFGNVVGGLASGGLAGAGGAISGALGSGSFAMAAGAIAAPLLAVAAVFSFFKKKTKELDSGLRVTVSNMETLVETFKTVQTTRFFGLSKKTTTTVGAADAEVANPITNAVSAIQSDILKMAGVLSIGSDAFKDFSYQMDISLKGLTEEQAAAKVQEELAKVGDAMADLIPNLSSFAQEGETTSQTLVRLFNSLQTANFHFNQLVGTMFQASLAGANLASNLIQAFGSAEAFNSSMDFFTQNFYSEAEQVTMASDRILAAFNALGLAAPATAAAFRQLVEGLMRDVTAGVAGAADTLAGVLATQQDVIKVDAYKAAQEAAKEAARQAAAQAAAQAREAARQEAAQKAERIAQERYNLETQLLQVQGNTAELRRRELLLLDPTNRALQEMIWKLEDAKDAMENISEVDFATKVDYLRAVGLARNNIPGFATGGMHIGGPRIVGENGPELEITGPSRIYSNQDTASMFRDPNLASAVNGLRKEVSGMRSEQLQIQVEVSKNVKRIYDIERKWDTDGLPPERV